MYRSERFSMNSLLALARITFKDTIRRPAFRAGGLGFLAVSGLSAVPFSPGITADGAHYLDAGLSTLHAGGIIIALMIVPFLLAPGRGRAAGEGLLALPLNPVILVTGIFSGFAVALLLFHLLGGGLLLLVSSASPAGPDDSTFYPALIWGALQSLLVSALVLCASRFLSYIPALMASILVLVLGHASGILPEPIHLFFPAMGAVDPVDTAGRAAAEALPALLHLLCFTALYLILAALGARGRPSA